MNKTIEAARLWFGILEGERAKWAALRALEARYDTLVERYGGEARS